MSKEDVMLLAAYVRRGWDELSAHSGVTGCTVDVDLVRGARRIYVATIRLDGDAEPLRELEVDPFLAVRNVFASVRLRLTRQPHAQGARA